MIGLFYEVEMKYQFDIQFFGGRGTSADFLGTPKTAPNGAVYYDVTKKYKNNNLQQFEDMIRNENVEYAGVFSPSGKLIQAVTQYQRGQSVIPKSMLIPGATFTHNHPHGQVESGITRRVGGAFSEADIVTFTHGKFGQIRAVANGVNEHTYILRAGPNSNYQRLYEHTQISHRLNTRHDLSINQQRKVTTEMRAKGYSEAQIRSALSVIAFGSDYGFVHMLADSAGFKFIRLKK